VALETYFRPLCKRIFAFPSAVASQALPATLARTASNRAEDIPIAKLIVLDARILLKIFMKLVPFPNQNQFDAIVSFAYNVGLDVNDDRGRINSTS
jgi:hypothetical protein